MAARAQALADRAEARLESRADRFELRNDVKASRALTMARRNSDRRTNHQVLGAVLLAIGGNWLLAEIGLFPFGWPGLLAAGLMTLGIAMISTAKAGRTKPLVALGVLMTFLLAMSSGVGGGFGGADVGDEFHRISSTENLLPVYENGIGDTVLDLSSLELKGAHEVEISTKVGDVGVVLPRGLAVRIVAEVAGIGDLNVLGTEREGFGLRLPYTSPGFESAPDRLELRLETGVGDITVEER